MKRLFLFLILASISIGMFAQSDFYYTPTGEKEYLKVRKDQVILRTQPKIDFEKIAQQSIFSSVENLDYNSNLLKATINPKQTNKEGLKKNGDIVDVSYLLEAGGKLLTPVDKIFVKPKKGQSLEKILDQIGLIKHIIKAELDSTDGIYLLVLRVKIDEILPLSRKLFKTGLCEIVEPSFLWFNVWDNG
jgi:hypothetical protein